MVDTIPRSRVVEMLRTAAREEGIDLHRFYHHGKADTLDDPELRDLWLIWGDVLTEDDLDEPEPIASR